MPLQAVPFIVILGALWGTTLVASRFSVDQFAPSTYIGLRLMLAVLGFALVYLLSKERRWPTDRVLWKRAALLGIFGTAIPMNFIVMSLQYQSSGITSILITLSPAITVVMAHFFLDDEHLSKQKLAGIALALSGALMLLLLGESGLPDVEKASPIGYGLVIAAMVCGSAMTIFARKKMNNMDSVDVSSVRMLVAALVVLPLSVLLVGFDLSAVDMQGALALGWAALAGTFLGMLIAFYIIKRFGATASAMTAYVIPVVASIVGMLVLGEKFTSGMLGGMALIVAGIAIINRRERKVVVAGPEAFTD
ncbi:DMT family transporter [Chloroflexota bacterium]